MTLPFTSEQFLSVFAEYNTAVWPAQIVLNAIALAAIGLALWPSRHSSRLISLILGLFWSWMGAVYHWAYFAAINPVAVIFGALFLLEGTLFLWMGAIRNRIDFRFAPNARGRAGGLIILYALVIYPVLGTLLGHTYPQNPTFGLPCPTTIFTFGMLLWAERALPKLLLVIPALWAVIGFSAAFQLGILEDTGLLLSGIIAVAWIWIESRARMKIRSA